ncbi:signal transduction histidine kinase/CheY-like chemotaxis protein [Caulobacter ginsengisoli]|uniref:histidine kinase n=1 Tax=Caulobacter ginsengisoli TaxID=400775 RepID=A0ABU0IQ29_9CAUL|nr:MHYT domain-containing protein [Caulobacter ginsengisoli]MDQ0464112.1 signal transduction histidine kinase/CheY-like chemotaxis protein [Caulobacter ginsengisoli]
MTQDHNPWLVLLAAAICVVAIGTAFHLNSRAAQASGAVRRGWTGLAGLLAGGGIWATHFIAMLAYQPDLAMGYDPLGTVLSLVLAAAALTGAFALTNSLAGRWAAPLAGGAAGLGIAIMHFVGMTALRLSADLIWRPGYVAASLAAAAGLAALAFFVAKAKTKKGRGRWRWLASSGIFVAAIVALHFTAMTAVVVVPNGAKAMAGQIIDRGGLAVIVAGFSMLMLGAALALLWVEGRSQVATLLGLRTSLDGLTSGLAIFDRQDRLVVWNRPFTEIARAAGAEPEAGQTMAELLSQAGTRTDGPVKQALADVRHTAVDREAQWPDGRWMRVQANPTADGGPVLIISDITAQREHADALAAARDAAIAASRAKSEFLANMSHEIRTPLNGVLAVADLLAQDSLNPNQQELVGIIRSSGDTLNRLLSDILDLARVETGRMETASEAFPLGETVRSVAGLFETKAKEKGLTFALDLPAGMERLVTGDPMRLKQILGNLLSNAVKFTEVGSVRLTVRDTESGVRFRVLDTGLGFDAQTRARLFQRFEQADSSVTRQFGGSGLGLSISQELVRLLGGTLDCRSQPGMGSAFTLVLPLPDAEADAGAPDADQEVSDAPSGLSVLVVDDHPTNRRVLELLLGGAGCEVTCADDGQAGLEAWRSGRFDVVLMDMQMPVLDGLAATRAIRAEELARNLPRTPVIMVSANALAEHLAASQAAGADNHISKPIAAAELFAALEVLTGPQAERRVA